MPYLPFLLSSIQMKKNLYECLNPALIFKADAVSVQCTSTKSVLSRASIQPEWSDPSLMGGDNGALPPGPCRWCCSVKHYMKYSNRPFQLYEESNEYFFLESSFRKFWISTSIHTRNSLL